VSPSSKQRKREESEHVPWLTSLTHLENTKVIKFLAKGFLHFLGGEYSGSNESLNVNEDNATSSFNLKDMCRKEALPIRHSSWCINECNLLDLEGVFLVKGHEVHLTEGSNYG
jgi:hypothetical protein